MDDAASEELATPRALAALTGLFGAAAALLVAIGLYGMVAQWVQGRRAELGIRMALGADSTWLVLRTVGRGLLLVAAGLGLGVPAALALSRLVRSLLYGVTPWEPGLVLGAVLAMLALGGLASFIPAPRARSVDPAEALRST